MKGQHRVVAGTKRGRQFTQSKGSMFVDSHSKHNTPEIDAHNKMIEEKKRLKGKRS